MSALSQTETQLWVREPKRNPPPQSDAQINDRYARGEGRILIETNRERLSVFVEASEKQNHLELSPFYQRRRRWDDERRSLLIESFIMNIPVPPVFLYENDFGKYEVMDGQQRISAILDFYQNKFALAGLESWPELNGRRYANLPDKVRAGIDRRSLSSIVLLRESATEEQDVSLLRRTVFERLNRGGVRLTRQEIRNALFAGPLNQLIHTLAADTGLTALWNGQAATGPQGDTVEDMDDLEVILRFFALRHAAHYGSSLQNFLDVYMSRMQKATDTDIQFLGGVFRSVFEIAQEIYGDYLFRPWNAKENDWSPKPNKGFSDCVLVGIAACLSQGAHLRSNRQKVISQTQLLFSTYPDGTFTGRKSTKQDVIDRLQHYEHMLRSI